MRDKCPLCGSTKVVYIDGEVVCSNCGAVIRQAEVERERKSKPGVKFPVIEHKFVEQHDRSDADARLMKAFAEQLSVPQIVQDEAELIIRKLYTLRKRPNDPTGVALAALYIAMRMHDMPVSFVDMKKLGLSGRTLNRVMKAINPRLPPQAPEMFLEKYASKLGLDERVVREALKILKKPYTHINPKIEAIAALYIAAHDGEKKQVATFAKVAEISSTALWKTVKRMQS